MTTRVGFLTTSTLADYLSLAKPRVVLLHLITAASAMFLAAGGMPPPAKFIFVLLGGGLMAGAANALNCFFDRDIDIIMARTRGRPLPAGRLRPGQALAFGLVTGLLGLLVLGLLVSPASAILGGIALAYYVLIYTVVLKRRTRWSAVLGSGAGAFPPVIGWVAVTGRLSFAPFILAFIIVFWTFPHFWSLAIFRSNEYESAGLKVSPAKTAPGWMFVCCLLLVAASILLAPAAGLGWIYLTLASLLGLGLFVRGAELWRARTASAARQLHLYSVLYLALLFGAIVADRLIF